MNPVLVCHVSTMTRWGGVEKLLSDFLVYSNQKDEFFRHVLLTTSHKPEIIHHLKEMGISHFQPQERFRFDPNKILSMALWMRQHNIQIVHSYNAYANSWANLATMAIGIPLITGEHGTVWGTPSPIAKLDYWANQRAKAVIANSNASAHLLAKRYKISSGKIQVLPNAVAAFPMADVSKMRSHWKIKEKTFIVGSVGRLEPVKNYTAFIKVAAELLKMRSDLVFMIVGSGKLENKLKTFVLKLGINNHFIFTGWRDDARSIIQMFDVFVNTSLRESFGNVLVEAAMCGKVVVAPWIDGIPDVVLHNVTGILVEPTLPITKKDKYWNDRIPKKTIIHGELKKTKEIDPKIFANIISKILDDEAFRQYLGQNAKERADRLFSMEKYSAKLKTIYRAVNLMSRR